MKKVHWFIITLIILIPFLLGITIGYYVSVNHGLVSAHHHNLRKA